MEGREESAQAAQSRIYCLIPRDLAPKLHELLRRHFRDDTSIEVVVERRADERRSGVERRSPEPGGLPSEGDRRRIRSLTGRRVAERRGALVTDAALPLPRKARPHAAKLAFVQRLEPSGEQLEDEDTARLVNRIQGGDCDGFTILYTRYFDRVYSYFKVALRDRHAAEELTQQVFVKALEALPRYERRGRTLFRAWLFTIVRNHAIKELERQGRSQVTDPSVLDRQRETIASDGAPPSVPDWLSDGELVMFFERLPLAQRQALMLRYMLNLGYAEIAAIMDRSEVDVRGLHSRGVRFLRARLGELGRELPTQRRHAVRARVRWARVASSRRWALHA